VHSRTSRRTPRCATTIFKLSYPCYCVYCTPSTPVRDGLRDVIVVVDARFRADLPYTSTANLPINRKTLDIRANEYGQHCNSALLSLPQHRCAQRASCDHDIPRLGRHLNHIAQTATRPKHIRRTQTGHVSGPRDTSPIHLMSRTSYSCGNPVSILTSVSPCPAHSLRPTQNTQLPYSHPIDSVRIRLKHRLQAQMPAIEPPPLLSRCLCLHRTPGQSGLTKAMALVRSIRVSFFYLNYYRATDATK
jgi:hypothetical protein